MGGRVSCMCAGLYIYGLALLHALKSEREREEGRTIDPMDRDT